MLTFPIHRSSVPRVKHELQYLHTNTTNPQTSMQQIETATDQRSVEPVLDIQEVGHIVTDVQTNNAEINDTWDQKVPQQESPVQQSLGRLPGAQRQVHVNLSEREAVRLAQTARSLLSPITSGSRDIGTSPIRSTINSSIQPTWSLTCWQCSRVCSCRCHEHRSNSMSPLSLDRFIGTLFLGYFGLPKLAKACDNAQCSQRSNPSVLIVYFFPTWLLARAMIILMKFSLTSRPELLIRVPRVLDANASIFHYSDAGDVNGIKRLFERGLSSPFDVDNTGYSALMVCIRAFLRGIFTHVMKAGKRLGLCGPD